MCDPIKIRLDDAIYFVTGSSALRRTRVTPQSKMSKMALSFSFFDCVRQLKDFDQETVVDTRYDACSRSQVTLPASQSSTAHLSPFTTSSTATTATSATASGQAACHKAHTCPVTSTSPSSQLDRRTVSCSLPTAAAAAATTTTTFHQSRSFLPLS